MSSARQDGKDTELNPKVHDPITPARRNRFIRHFRGAVMQPIHISLVVGKRGSGVSTLLNAFRERADTRDMRIVDDPASV